MAARLADDINSLPPSPSGSFNCAIDYGTSYHLTFRDQSGDSWTAVVGVLGCELVTVNDGRVLRAVDSPLYADLGTALDLAPFELIPQPCPAPGIPHCYAQPPV